MISGVSRPITKMVKAGVGIKTRTERKK